MFFRTLISATLLFTTLPLEAGTQLLREKHPEVPDTEVRLESVFGAAAQQGALPFKITIRNNSGKDRVWNILLKEGSYNRTLITQWQGTVTVENGKEVVREVILPFAPNFASYTYRNMEASFASAGLSPIRRSTGYQVNEAFPTLALSQPLATRSLAKLDDIIKKKGRADLRFGESFEAAELPSDWKGYTGLDAILFDRDTWLSLGNGPKRAILEWVRLGGTLHLYFSKSESPEFSTRDLGIEGLNPPPGERYQAKFSLGTIEVKEWNGKELPSSLVNSYGKMKLRSKELGEDYRGKDWTLAEKLGEKPFNSFLLFGILLVFAILVAPVNLFYFAGKGKRHRLFYTTPIISIGACLVIVALIFLGDGLGGKGYRAGFADLQSGEEERRLYLSQEQFSRTGVILNTGFKSEEDLLIEPVRPRDSVFFALHRRSGQSTVYNYTDNLFAGGFFRSRSEQAFLLRSVEPTRARIEFRSPPEDDKGPVLVSSLPTGLGEFFYQDGNEKIWKSPSGTITPPGDTIPLEPASPAAFNDFIEEQVAAMSDNLGDRIAELSAAPNRFYAIPVDPSAYLITTHAGIRWADDRILLSGTVETPAQPEPLSLR